MKWTYVLLVMVVLAVALTAVVWAGQEGGMGAPEERGTGMGVMRGMGGMGGPAIAASGNSVYVVTGGKILKYDSELNLLKQAELPAMERPSGGRMREGRMMRGGGMRGGGTQGGANK